MSKELIGGSIDIGTEKWTIYTTYMREDKENNWIKIEDALERNPCKKFMKEEILTPEQPRKGDHLDEEVAGKSKDKCRNRDGETLLGNIKMNGLQILNGSIEGDEEEQWTYLGGGRKSTIDYVITNLEERDEIKKLEIGDTIDSDHIPVMIELDSPIEEEQQKQKEITLVDWSERGIKIYRED